jgi:hypothetical protein
MDQLSPDNTVEHDPRGHVKPSRKAVLEIERKYPDASPGRKWQLTQAQTLIDAVKVDPRSSNTDS